MPDREPQSSADGRSGRKATASPRPAWALQVDSESNVNVSRRGAGARDYFGPGGFIDLTAAARTIVRRRVDGARRGRDQRRWPADRQSGHAEFVEQVDEVIFNGPRALTAGKRGFCATHVGLFQLTRRGMELGRAVPGIDVRRDILDRSPMRIVLPESGRVPRIPRSLVAGEPACPRNSSVPIRLRAGSCRTQWR